MKKRFLGLLLLSVISMPFGVKGAFAEHVEKSYKSWANSIYVYTGLGESVDIIDPVKMKKIGTIPGFADIHNCFTSYDGTSLYITAEKEIVKVSFKGKKGGGEIKRYGLRADGLGRVAWAGEGMGV